MAPVQRHGRGRESICKALRGTDTSRSFPSSSVFLGADRTPKTAAENFRTSFFISSSLFRPPLSFASPSQQTGVQHDVLLRRVRGPVDGAVRPGARRAAARLEADQGLGRPQPEQPSRRRRRPRRRWRWDARRRRPARRGDASRHGRCRRPPLRRTEAPREEGQVAAAAGTACPRRRTSSSMAAAAAFSKGAWAAWAQEAPAASAASAPPAATTTTPSASPRPSSSTASRSPSARRRSRPSSRCAAPSSRSA